jgi:putative nucleotidyltransferase with HDIG domain
VEQEVKKSTDKLLKAMEDTMHALARVVEMRDPYTAGHQRRATELACAIAAGIGMSPDRITGLRVAGLIHDIGKVRVPAEILTNPDGLSEAEFAIIRTHPSLGYEILKTIEFPWPVADIVYQHHERIDGSGYPQGLRGENIVREARVLAVADVVEAIASHRPYRPALGIEHALQEISNNRGRLYERDAVDACLALFRERAFEFH